ncbi:hypothetical protein TNCV_1489981 [Trichonephila clavipes]|nr:hypothetical protein TNCV_1489981 [Trichonephila clavipes]
MFENWVASSESLRTTDLQQSLLHAVSPYSAPDSSTVLKKEKVDMIHFSARQHNAFADHLIDLQTYWYEEDTTMPYSVFKREPTRLEVEGHILHIGWAVFSKMY